MALPSLHARGFRKTAQIPTGGGTYPDWSGGSLNQREIAAQEERRRLLHRVLDQNSDGYEPPADKVAEEQTVASSG